MIYKLLYKFKKEVPGKIIFLTQYGSRLYGLDTEQSDYDFRGVFIPRIEDIILKKDVDEVNTVVMLYKITDPNGRGYYTTERPTVFPNNNRLTEIPVEVKLFSIYKFLKLCAKADSNALDVLFAVNPKTNSDFPDGRIQQYYSGEYTEEFIDVFEPRACMDHNTIISWYPIQYIWENAHKLINTDNLHSPIRYANAQAVKYGLKGERYNKICELRDLVKKYSELPITPIDATIATMMTDYVDENGDSIIAKCIDDKHIKIDELDNKGTLETYLFVGGVQHSYRITVQKLIQRLDSKLTKEYTSDRTLNATDGSDWKALSHATRILGQVEELMEKRGYSFPCKEQEYLMDIKQGRLPREEVDNEFQDRFDKLIAYTQEDKLGWRYDEEFWNSFLLEVIRANQNTK